MQRLNIGAALLGVAVTSLLGTSSAASLDQFIGFGDSTMDSGYFRYGPTGGSPGLPPGAPSDAIDILIRRTVAAGGTGAFMGPGVVDTIQLAAKFGLAAAPVTIPGGGGTNYANGSAQSVPTTAGDGYLSGLYNNVPIVAQISNYLAAVRNAANPNALYMISFGGNDLTWLDTQGGGVPPQAYLSSLATALTASVATLQAAGARTIVVLDPYAYSRLVGPNGALTAADAITEPGGDLRDRHLVRPARRWGELRSSRCRRRSEIRIPESDTVRFHTRDRVGEQPGMRCHVSAALRAVPTRHPQR